jgi:hypothetical protein
MTSKPDTSHGVRAPRRAALALAIAALLAPGCSSIFKSYPSQLDPVYACYRNGDFARAAELIESDDFRENRDDVRDGILWTLEAGKLLHAAGRFRESNEAFSQAERKIDDMDSRPRVSVRDALDEAASAATNLNAIPYNANPAERILLNTYKAMNYLALGDLEGALVEMRRADDEQKEAVGKYQKEIDAVRDEARSIASSRDVDVGGIAGHSDNRSRIDAIYADLRPLLSPAYAKFVNPFTSYLSAICYVAAGDTDNARVDYARLLGMTPGSVLIRNDAEVLDKQGIDAFRGSVFILFENGAGPRREEVRIDLIVPVPNYVTYVGFAFPRVVFQPAEVAALHVRSTGPEGYRVQTERIASIDGIVATAFEQQKASMIARIVASTLTKAVLSNVNKMTHRREGVVDFLTRLIVGIYSAVVNNADLRSWMTLGKEFQIARIPAPPGGILYVSLVDAGGRRGPEQTVQLSPGDIHFLIARSVRGGQLSLFESATRVPSPL